jgi:hypothetical protein
MTEAVAQLQKGLDQLASLPDNSRREALELNLQITPNVIRSCWRVTAPRPG